MLVVVLRLDGLWQRSANLNMRSDLVRDRGTWSQGTMSTGHRPASAMPLRWRRGACYLT